MQKTTPVAGETSEEETRRAGSITLTLSVICLSFDSANSAGRPKRIAGEACPIPVRIVNDSSMRNGRARFDFNGYLIKVVRLPPQGWDEDANSIRVIMLRNRIMDSLLSEYQA